MFTLLRRPFYLLIAALSDARCVVRLIVVLDVVHCALDSDLVRSFRLPQAAVTDTTNVRTSSDLVRHRGAGPPT